jgi:hypothetical protein
MLPLLCPTLYLPVLQHQTTIKQDIKEENPITINDFNNSANQDMLCDSLINSETTTALHFNIHQKKALLQELV